MSTELFEGNYHKDLYVKENNIFVCIDGCPVSLKRHRTRVILGSARMYDSQKELKKEVLKRVIMQIPKGFVPFQSSCQMIIEFHIPMPYSWSRAKRNKMKGKLHAQKPDASNLWKFYEDMFNGILYKDDSLISSVKGCKIWQEEGRTIICIRKMDSPEVSYIDELKNKESSI